MGKAIDRESNCYAVDRHVRKIATLSVNCHPDNVTNTIHYRHIYQITQASDNGAEEWSQYPFCEPACALHSNTVAVLPSPSAALRFRFATLTDVVIGAHVSFAVDTGALGLERRVADAST